MATMSRITDTIFLSLFWLLGCLPVVTVGAATAALYDSSFRGARQAERHPWQRFWQVFLRNWKVGILPTVVFLVLSCGLGWGMIQAWNSAVRGALSWMVFAAAAVAAVLVLGILGILFPMLSRFDDRPGTLLKNTVLLALAHLPRTFLLGVLETVSILVCARLLIPIFFLPSLTALIASFLIEPMFRPYLEGAAS